MCYRLILNSRNFFQPGLNFSNQVFFFTFFLGEGVLKKNNMHITNPNPFDPPNPNPNRKPNPKPNRPRFFFILYSPGFEHQTSDFEVHLHLH